MTDMADRSVVIAIEGGVADIQFNRPARLNAIDEDMARAFQAAVEAALRDDVRAILLSGAGRAFLVGGDLSFFRDAKNPAASAAALIGPLHDALKRLADSGIPVIVAAHGLVAGAGMSLAALADLAIAADNARFSMSYIKIAASPDCGGSWALPRAVGRKKAAELALLSDPIDAQEALRIGLVNKVVPLDELRSTALDWAKRVAGAGVTATRSTRALLEAAPGRTLADQLDAELTSFTEAAGTAEFANAVAAFFISEPVSRNEA